MQFVLTVSPAWAMPTTSSTVRVGSLLATNSPGGLPIKPLAWEFVAAGVMGPAAGWATLAAAESSVATLTAGAAGAAAIVHDGIRFVAFTLAEGLGLGSSPALERATGTTHLRESGGVFWRHDALVAVVDGNFIERFA